MIDELLPHTAAIVHYLTTHKYQVQKTYETDISKINSLHRDTQITNFVELNTIKMHKVYKINNNSDPPSS